MESNQGGDLGDIIRASSRGCGGSLVEAKTTKMKTKSTTEWQFPSLTSLTEPGIGFPSPTTDASFNSGFGDPFFNLGRDPFMVHELSAGTVAESESSMGVEIGNSHVGVNGVGGAYGGDSNSDFGNQKMILQPILSRFLEISATSSPVNVSRQSTIHHQQPPILAPSASAFNNVSSRCLSDHAPGLQISSTMSSPRNPGIKRRKSQAKKVVCIPATAASGSRPTGEVVPSDLWAWRKYGQKPIKGSPYPRGYYRCSSSKGCSARKQVERSRSDPNMLVITYTSEHNHPWPTQRNALAGSTRAQAAKTNGWSSKNSGQKHNPRVSGQEDKHKEMANSSAPVKEEAVEMEKSTPVSSIDKTDDNYNCNYNCDYNLDHSNYISYSTTTTTTTTTATSSFPESRRFVDDFFAELAELDDPLELFSKQLLEEKEEEEEEEEEDDEDDYAP